MHGRTIYWISFNLVKASVLSGLIRLRYSGMGIGMECDICYPSRAEQSERFSLKSTLDLENVGTRSKQNSCPHLEDTEYPYHLKELTTLRLFISGVISLETVGRVIISDGRSQLAASRSPN
jgi:hypothetical protein